MKLAVLLPHLDERQRRLLVAVEARDIGRRGIQYLSNITGISRPTIYRGLKDLNQLKKENLCSIKNSTAWGWKKKSN